MVSARASLPLKPGADVAARMTKPRRRVLPAILISLVGAIAAATGGPARAEKPWYPQPIETREPPFHPHGTFSRVDYVPLPGASRPWELCASLPTLGVDYFDALAYGLRQEATRQGVRLSVEDARGGGPARQRDQLAACLDNDAEALILVALQAGQLDPIIARARANGVPVIDLATGSGSDRVTARVRGDPVGIAKAAGRYIAERHPRDTTPLRLIWLAGPTTAAFTGPLDLGFRAGIAGSAVDIVGGDHVALDDEAIRSKLRELRAGDNDFNALASTANVIRAAIDEFRGAGAIELMAVNLTRPIVAGVKRHEVLAAVNDRPVAQARIAVDLAVRAAEGKPLLAEVRPQLDVLDRTTLDTFDPATTLPPENQGN